MEVEVVDPNAWLTKTQKMKIKTLYKENKTKDEILSKVHYQEEYQKYRDLQIEKEGEKKVKLLFSEIDPREELKNKLKMKLGQKMVLRANNYKNEAWKQYYDLLRNPVMNKLPPDTLKKVLPNPTDVKQNAEMYEMMNKNNPNPVLKKYFQTCLEQ
jgi:hypothetical protein